VIWLFVTLVVLAYFLVFALMRAAALSDERLDKLTRRIAKEDGPWIRVYRRPNLYDWEERSDFDE
jgi:hypothetical protein